MTIERPMFPPRAESVHAFPMLRPPGDRPDEMPAGDSHKAANGLSRRNMLVGAAALPALGAMTIPAAASAPFGADAELIALGKQLEILVDAYYAARQPWALAMCQYHSELEERFGHPADRGYRDTDEIRTAEKEIEARVGLRKAGDELSAVYERIESIAKAIEALPCTSIEGLRTKALVAFWEVAPLAAGDGHFHFEDAYPFERLFCAVAEFCGLDGKVGSTGFDMPLAVRSVDEDEEDEEDDEEDV